MNSNENAQLSAPYAVTVEGLNVAFGDFFAVRNVSFSVRQGEIFGFLGANGAGKTTTIRVLCGLLKPTSGLVLVDGASYADGEMSIKAKVGYMSQKFTLYNDLTVQENLDFTAHLRKIGRKTATAMEKHLLEFIGFDQPRKTLVKNLPGGIKQQVSLAASLLHDPTIIFLDEPTAGVTPAARQRFWALIRELQAKGKTIFVTTHYMDEAEYCDRIALMRSGELIALDSVENLKTSAFPNSIYEIEAKDRGLTHSEYLALKNNPDIESVQPYGIRYHVSFRSQESLDSQLPQLQQQFIVQKKMPSLEDVFIKLVEGSDR